LRGSGIFERVMKVLILGAGYGTRLYPLITDTPKPLLPIAGAPLVNHTLKRLEAIQGIHEIVVVTNDKFYNHFVRWSQEAAPKARPIHIVNDGTTTPDNRLGSVGDILYVLRHHAINDDLLVIGGDNLFDFDLDAYAAFSRAKMKAVTVGLYDIQNTAAASKFGVVAVDAGKKVVSFEEKPEYPKSSLIAMCCYFMPSATLGWVEEYAGCSQKTDKAGDYIRWLTTEKEVYGFEFTGTWYDIGSIESYREAQEKFT